MSITALLLMTPPSAYDAYAFWPLRGQNRSTSPASLGRASDKLHSTKSQVFPLKRCSFMYLMTR